MNGPMTEGRVLVSCGSGNCPSVETAAGGGIVVQGTLVGLAGDGGVAHGQFYGSVARLVGSEVEARVRIPVGVLLAAADAYRTLRPGGS